MIHNRMSKSSGKWESQDKTTYQVAHLEEAAEAAVKGRWKFVKEESTVGSASDLLFSTCLNGIYQAHESYGYTVNPPREIEIFIEGNKFFVRGYDGRPGTRI